MGRSWSYRDWQPGGERATFGELSFDSRLHCGNAHDFVQVAPEHYRFRARAHRAPYAWRFLFRIDSPGDGREITLEVADFNHEGRTPWHESATAWSTDSRTWLPFPADRLELVDWTRTGDPEIDDAYGDATHVPYGVRYRLRLEAPRMWFASPTPFTLQHRDALLEGLSDIHPHLVTTEVIGHSAHSRRTGHPVTMARITGEGEWRRRTRILVLAGEHAAETAGMCACEGFMREVLGRPEWLERFAFFFVPVLNVDGVFFGRTYFNVSPGVTDGPGVNLSDTWDRRPCPEQRALWRVLIEVRPDLLVSLHNGRHRREMDQFSDGVTEAAPINEALRRHLGFELVDQGRVRPGRLAEQAVTHLLARRGFLTETLLLDRLPGCEPCRDRFLQVGRQLARGYAEAMADVYTWATDGPRIELPRLDAAAPVVLPMGP